MSIELSLYNQKGFTLLEMVLVLFLVGLMASATLMLTEGVEDQAKYDETKRRLELIRLAIVGDPTRVSNGSSEISGFAADMGRLPLCLNELLELGPASGASPVMYQSVCNGGELIPEWNRDTSTGISYGWRGPYLQVLAERNGDLRFRDGYLNDDNANPLDSGWIYVVSGAELSLSSRGYDVNDTQDDVPKTKKELIHQHQWIITDVDVTFINTSTSDAVVAIPPRTVSSDPVLVLRVYTGDSETYSDSIPLADLDELPVNDGENNNKISKSFTFDTSSAIPLGRRSYEIVCAVDDGTDPDDYVVFERDCDSGNSNSGTPKNYIKVIPGQSLILDWRL